MENNEDKQPLMGEKIDSRTNEFLDSSASYYYDPQDDMVEEKKEDKPVKSAPISYRSPKLFAPKEDITSKPPVDESSYRNVPTINPSYASPNAHSSIDESNKPSPYVVPQYEASHYQRPHEQPNINISNPSKMLTQANINIFVSGLYVVVALLTVIQGFGILVSGRMSSFLLGLFAMFFGVAAVLFDLQGEIMGHSMETWFPFLGNYFGRGLTLLFFGTLSGETYYSDGWNKFIMVFDILVAILYLIIHFTSTSLQSTPQHQDLDVYTDF